VGADSDLDAVQPVSSSLRSAQHRGSETDASADATEEQADGDGAEADPDGLDELASVTSSLRSAQSRVSGDDDPDDDGDLSASDAGRVAMPDSSTATGAGRASGDSEAVTDVAPMLAVYRHDVHKLRGRSHTAASERVAGVRVNETVPLGADRDAALLSRPDGEPEQTLDAHASPGRVSLLTGDVVMTGSVGADGRDAAVREVVQVENPGDARGVGGV